MLNVFMLSVVMLNVVMLSVVAASKVVCAKNPEFNINFLYNIHKIETNVDGVKSNVVRTNLIRKHEQMLLGLMSLEQMLME